MTVRNLMISLINTHPTTIIKYTTIIFTKACLS